MYLIKKRCMRNISIGMAYCQFNNKVATIYIFMYIRTLFNLISR